MAYAENRWTPLLRPMYVFGFVHGDGIALSSEQNQLNATCKLSMAPIRNLAVVDFVVNIGLERKNAVGRLRSPGICPAAFARLSPAIWLPIRSPSSPAEGCESVTGSASWFSRSYGPVYAKNW